MGGRTHTLNTPGCKGVARIFQRGGHTGSYRGYSPDCHLNIVGCLLTKRLTKGGGGGHGHPRTPLATPTGVLVSSLRVKKTVLVSLTVFSLHSRSFCSVGERSRKNVESCVILELVIS